uniref:Alpha-defensin N-terminal domain-containing protein n=1 Tax=Nannospalax galili TaxID=1026970 RepID=A0A8C6RGK9_NANGA
MRTLVFLAALLLLALQAQAESIQGTDEDSPYEEPWEEEQPVSISFSGLENSDLQKAG